ncbi:cystatin-S-like [Phodopus roborovskii]|uniref:cystatin-S-like n=1 Tax=Phodopus roborovskii TaxID=109678 RepID=UPI0021E36D5D|nr:cystatin-S-like [Phodopus roborovskii]
MAYLPHAPLLLLIILVVPPNLSQSDIFETLFPTMQKHRMNKVMTQEALDYAVSKYNEISSDLNLSRVVEVLSVYKLQREGTIFYFEVILGQTICMKDESDLTNCPLFEQAVQQERKLCIFLVYVASDETHPSMETLTCTR